MIVLAALMLAANLLLVGVLVWHVLHTEGKHTETVMQLLAAQDIEREQARNQLRDLVELHTRERETAHPDLTELIALTDRLCQRVQAPEQAVLEHQLQDLPVSPPAVTPDDDDAYWEAMRGTTLDKESLAEQLMEAELNGG